jgi:hypothetical protein
MPWAAAVSAVSPFPGGNCHPGEVLGALEDPDLQGNCHGERAGQRERMRAGVPVLSMRIVPPLDRGTTWIELSAAGDRLRSGPPCHLTAAVWSRRAFPSGQVKRVDLLLELERVDQQVQQEVAGPEVACGGPDAPAGE